MKKEGSKEMEKRRRKDERREEMDKKTRGGNEDEEREEGRGRRKVRLHVKWKGMVRWMKRR